MSGVSEQAWTKEPWFVIGEVGVKGSPHGFKPTIVSKTAHDSNEYGCVSVKELEATPQKFICDVRGPGREWGMPSAETEANAHRIVACVNACAGIPTADLPALSASRERERVLRQDLSDCIDVLQMCIDDDTRMKESTRGGIVGCINVLRAALAKTGGG